MQIFFLFHMVAHFETNLNEPDESLQCLIN